MLLVLKMTNHYCLVNTVRKASSKYGGKYVSKSNDGKKNIVFLEARLLPSIKQEWVSIGIGLNLPLQENYRNRRKDSKVFK